VKNNLQQQRAATVWWSPRKFPEAPSLRVIMDSQRVESLHVARRLGNTDPARAARWERRGEVDGRLVHETRDLGGMVGNGGPAAGQACCRSRTDAEAPDDGLGDPKQTKRLERISAGIDERVCDAVEPGVKERLYFERVVVPGMNDHKGELLKVLGPKYLPITSPAQTELLRSSGANCARCPFSASPREAQRRAASTSRPR
jgi:hypothetical protein